MKSKAMRNLTTSEILSHLRKLLRLLTDSTVGDREGISNASTVLKGERRMKDTVHYFVHHTVHSVSGSSEREKRQCAR
jgi:hypothetical protein